MNYSHNTRKNYYEFLAKLLLEHSLPDQYVDLKHQDRPDLFCEKNDIGIEVSRSMFQFFENANSIFNCYKGKDISEVKQKDIDYLDKNGYKFFAHKDKVVGWMPKEAHWVTLDPLKRVFNSKLKKLDSYAKHTENDLFIFGPLFDEYDTRDIFEFGHWIYQKQSQSNHQFDKVFIFDDPILYLCDYHTYKLLSYHFPKDVLTQLCQQAATISK